MSEIHEVEYLNAGKAKITDIPKSKPTPKEKKQIRKGYRQAGAIYWTKDMEKMIRGLQANRKFWRAVALFTLPAALLFFILWAGTL